MGTLCKYFRVILEDFDIEYEICTGNLRKKIEKHFGSILSFVSCPGKPTLVLSKINEYDIIYSSITQDDSCSSDDDDELLASRCTQNENLVLHKAAGILRQSILNHQTGKTKFYGTPEMINPKNCRSEIPDILYKFMAWIINEAYFNESVHANFDINVIAICSSILTSFDKLHFCTTFNLGLSIYVYQTVRSKKILDFFLILDMEFHMMKCEDF